MSKLEQLKEKAKGLEGKDPRKAIEIWIEALKTQESDGEANPDLSIYNRIGDLYIKLKDPGQAADYYDRAVDKYAELGFHNNAIAMCNKVLRNAPARQTTYLKLAKLYAAKGFMAEAQQNFVQYAERMQKAGKIEHAFSALKEFTDISPESENLREILYEHLKMYGDPGRRSAARATPPAAPKHPGDDVTKSGKRKTSSLVFLDLDEPSPARAGRPGAPGAPIAPPGPRGTAIVIHLAREWGMAALADALGQAADERYEPTWDREGGEFTWGFGLDEEHPRGQYNAAMAAAEAMTEGAWHRLAQVLPSERFNQPTVTGIDFPDFTLTQAWWDGERRRLVLTSTGRAEADTRKPTTFRVTNLGDPSGWTVEAEDGGPVESSAVDGDLEVRTTIGTHRLVVRRA